MGQDEKVPQEAPGGVYKDKEQVEADALGYGPGHPPWFTTVFLVCVKRDRKTGGVEEVSYQTKNFDSALTKIRDQMRVERTASRKDVEMAVQEILKEFDAQRVGEETAYHVLTALEEQDRKARQIIDDMWNAGVQPAGGEEGLMK